MIDLALTQTFDLCLKSIMTRLLYQIWALVIVAGYFTHTVKRNFFDYSFDLDVTALFVGYF